MYIVQKRLVNIKTKICSIALLTSWVLRQVFMTEMRLINILVFNTICSLNQTWMGLEFSQTFIVYDVIFKGGKFFI